MSSSLLTNSSFLEKLFENDRKLFYNIFQIDKDSNLDEISKKYFHIKYVYYLILYNQYQLIFNINNKFNHSNIKLINSSKLISQLPLPIFNELQNNIYKIKKIFSILIDTERRSQYNILGSAGFQLLELFCFGSPPFLYNSIKKKSYYLIFNIFVFTILFLIIYLQFLLIYLKIKHSLFQSINWMIIFIPLWTLNFIFFFTCLFYLYYAKINQYYNKYRKNIQNFIYKNNEDNIINNEEINQLDQFITSFSYSPSNYFAVSPNTTGFYSIFSPSYNYLISNKDSNINDNQKIEIDSTNQQDLINFSSTKIFKSSSSIESLNDIEKNKITSNIELYNINISNIHQDEEKNENMDNNFLSTENNQTKKKKKGHNEIFLISMISGLIMTNNNNFFSQFLKFFGIICLIFFQILFVLKLEKFSTNNYLNKNFLWYNIFIFYYIFELILLFFLLYKFFMILKFHPFKKDLYVYNSDALILNLNIKKISHKKKKNICNYSGDKLDDEIIRVTSEDISRNFNEYYVQPEGEFSDDDLNDNSEQKDEISQIDLPDIPHTTRKRDNKDIEKVKYEGDIDKSDEENTEDVDGYYDEDYADDEEEEEQTEDEDKEGFSSILKLKKKKKSSKKIFYNERCYTIDEDEENNRVLNNGLSLISPQWGKIDEFGEIILTSPYTGQFNHLLQTPKGKFPDDDIIHLEKTSKKKKKKNKKLKKKNSLHKISYIEYLEKKKNYMNINLQFLIILKNLLFSIIRIIFIILLSLKLDKIIRWNWNFVFLPLYIYLLLHLFYITSLLIWGIYKVTTCYKQNRKLSTINLYEQLNLYDQKNDNFSSSSSTVKYNDLQEEVGNINNINNKINENNEIINGPIKITDEDYSIKLILYDTFILNNNNNKIQHPNLLLEKSYGKEFIRLSLTSLISFLFNLVFILLIIKYISVLNKNLYLLLIIITAYFFYLLCILYLSYYFFIKEEKLYNNNFFLSLSHLS